MQLSHIAYICSSGRSGSTLLNVVLGSHQNFTCLNEIEQLPKDISLDTVCSCGEHVSHCNFWPRVIESIRERHGINILEDPYSFELGFPKAGVVIDPTHQTRQYLIKRRVILGLKYVEYRFGVNLMSASISRDYNQRVQNTFTLFEAVADISQKPGIVDSSKHYVRAVSLYNAEPDKFRIILLLRDGRAVFNANLQMGRSPATSLKFWKGYYERALPLLKQRIPPRHLHILKYEDLVTDTESTLKRLCVFLDVPYSRSMLNFREGQKHGLSGNSMRLSSVSEIALDERWRRQLSTSELSFFEKKGGKMLNELLGYY